ncbi:MAG: UDP-N-acetylmuramate dehydrogenase [Firmicutes bacterium]|nr:UDP-N-acetylmuramate dehydrogenase [Bacillota bacterium]
MDQKERIAAQFGEIVGDWRVQIDCPLSRMTTFKIGGPAAYVVTPSNVEELKKIIEVSRENGLRMLVLGKGSNILACDEGFRGVIVRLDFNFNNVKVNGTEVEAESGITLSALSKKVAEKGLGGLEFASGIPGTLGGAIYMNAGAYGGEMKDIIKEVTVLDTAGQLRTLSCEELNLGYRSSILQYKSWIVVKAVLQLEERDPALIKARMQELKEQRNAKQPVEMPSAGSVFKRPEGYFAGTLIDQAGLKGYSVGDAMVSTKHAGFIVNNGNATCKDVIGLIRHIQKTIKEKDGVDLYPEIRYLTPLGIDVIR